MIPKARFGRTGHMSTRTLFGAAALGSVTQDEADRTLDLLLEYGINHIDTAASYGESELRIGPWMAQHRNDFFLATKTGDRTYEKAKESIHRSLERLRVSSVDLIQLHYLVEPNEWEVAMGPGGALEACIEARDQGLVKYIGVTGHDVAVVERHFQSLEQFDFDSVLLPYNYIMMQNPQYVADFEALMALCTEQNVAVQTIKSIALRPWGDEEHVYSTWYRPLTDAGEIETAVHWVLNRPGIFLNSASDITLLPKVLEAASNFQFLPSTEPLSRQLAELEPVPLFV